MLLMLTLSSFNASALEAYAAYDDYDGTLTFYYDNQRESRPEMTFDITVDEEFGPEWHNLVLEGESTFFYVEKVVFDSSFAGARPTSTALWFADMRSLGTITGMQYLNTSEVTDMYGMFQNCDYLGVEQKLDVSNFDTGNVTDMSYMFAGCSRLQELNVSNFDTHNVTSMESMFAGCLSLRTLDLTHFDTRNLTNMMDMFGSCHALGNISFGEFDTHNVTSMDGAFSHCSSLESLDLSFMDTRNVTNMGAMFAYSNSLVSINLSSFNTANVTYMGQMFQGCSLLTTIIVGDGWTTSRVTNSYSMFLDCTSLEGNKGTTYDSNHVDKAYAHVDGGPSNPGYLTDVNSIVPYVAISTDYTTMTFYYDGKRDTRPGPTQLLNGPGETPAWVIYYPYAITTAVFDASFAQVRPTCTYSWFALPKLTEIENLYYLNTSEVTDMNHMFDGAASLESINVSGLDTHNVTDMAQMFQGCTSLTWLNLSSFDTHKVTNMNGMFRGCTNLSRLDLSHFDTHNVTKMIWMFRDCGNLATIYVGPYWNTDNVTTSTGMFNGCTSLVGGKGTTFDSNHVDKAYAHIDGGPSNPGYLTDKFENYSAYAFLMPVPGPFGNGKMLVFNYDDQRDMYGSYYPTFDLNVGDSYPEWYEDGTFDVVTRVSFSSSFADARPTTTANWFAEMSNLTGVEGIENLNTSEVTSMGGMFWECNILPNVDVSGFDTHNVTNMGSMFAECYELTGLDVSGFDTRNVTDMSSMFNGCSELTFLDVSNFNTAKVTNMFGMFSGCGGLTSLDLRSFDTRKVTNMGYMFSSCSGLRTIYAGSTWSTASVANSYEMFDYCLNLVGGKGTTYSSSNPRDKTYAHIDGGPSNPGYFTGEITFLRGDVNNDGNVSISDVTALIDYLLSGDASGVNMAGADCNQDSGVSISDVTALIDYLLSGSW
jgi:surface protein